MKSKEEFKAKLKDGEFIKLFAGVKSAEEVSKVAKNLGYDVKPADVKSSTLTDDMLEAVAGGAKGSNIQSNDYSAKGQGSSIKVGDVSNEGDNWDAESNPTINPDLSPTIK